MPDNVGTMTPVSGGVPGAASIASPIPYTLLSLPRFARMVGIAPLHFAGATAASLNPAVFPTGSSCGDVWPRYDWQKSDQVSHEALALAIKDAEESLAREVGYWAAPMWIAGEQVMYPRDLYREAIYQTVDVRGFRKAVNTRYGRVLSAGQRAVTLLGTATTVGGSLAYTDEDGDGLYETATITLAVTGITDACEAKVYHPGQSAVQDWEIRSSRYSKTISGGVLTIIMDSWNFIDPDLLSAFPTDDGFQAIDMSTVTPLIGSAEVYREYNDVSNASAIFKWETATPGGCTCSTCNGAGCPACSNTEQDGCLQVRDPEAGIVVPVPAAYSAGSWSVSAFDVCRAPDKIEIYYFAGDRDNNYLRGVSCDPLSDYWAWCILWLAIARLERPPCSCNRLKNMFDFLREDLSHSTAGSNYFAGDDVAGNPFGTHRGELMAWKRVKHHTGRRLSVAVL